MPVLAEDAIDKIDDGIEGLLSGNFISRNKSTFKNRVTITFLLLLNGCLINLKTMAVKYTVSSLSFETELGFIKSGEIAIPEIQRRFVWKPKQVRDLIDFLNTGYPTGYLIISQNPDMKLMDGSLAAVKKRISEIIHF